MFKLSLFTIAAAAGFAFATTTTNTPGASCVASSGTLSPLANGAIQNAGASGATASCPADRQLAPSLATKVAATVWVIDQSTSGNVCCTVSSHNTSGATVSSPSVCSAGKSSAIQALSLAQITDTYTFSSFYVSCTLPAAESGVASQIVTYRTVQD